MSLIMKKYRLNNKDYLVYEKNIFNKDFTAKQWSVLADNQYGIGTDYIVVINGKQICFYNKYGMKISVNKTLKDIVSFHLNCEQKDYKNLSVSRNIEVHFTQSYIDRVCFRCELKAHIA